MTGKGCTYVVYFNAGTIQELHVQTKSFDTIAEARKFADEVSEGGSGFGIWHKWASGAWTFVESGLPRGGI